MFRVVVLYVDGLGGLVVWAAWLGWCVTGGYVVFGFPDKVPGFCGFL